MMDGQIDVNGVQPRQTVMDRLTIRSRDLQLGTVWGYRSQIYGPNYYTVINITSPC